MFDLCIQNCKLIGKDGATNIYVLDGKIAEISDEQKEARGVLDANGAYALPGFIDAHVHIESSLLSVSEFSKLVLQHGTTTVIADPHEICNVLGLRGLELFIEESKNVELNVYFVVPSCVPASPLVKSGATLGVEEIKKGLAMPSVLGLGEMMNFPGVINRDKEVMDKIRAAPGKVVNGHAPGLRGEGLKKYVSAGIHDDHECGEVDEVLEKISAGMKIMIREGSGAKSPDGFYELLQNHSDEFMFCTDDKEVDDIQKEGHINHNVKKALRLGGDPQKAIACASRNAAKHFGLENIGDLDVGKSADILIVKELEKAEPETVIVNGRIVVRNGELVTASHHFQYPEEALHSIKHQKVSEEEFKIEAKGNARVILASEGSLVTEEKIADPNQEGVSKIAVVSRYEPDAKPVVGFVRGFGLKSGAIASSVSHDCHNIVVVGENERDMATAVNAIIEADGGWAVSRDGETTALLPLPVAGLMSDKPYETVGAQLKLCKEKAQELGTEMSSPFTTLSFMALEVIPKLKITAGGLVDVEGFHFVDLFVEP